MAPNPLALVFSKSKTSRTRMVVFSFTALFALILAACGGPTTGNTTTPQGGKHVLTVLANPGKEFTPNFNPFMNTSNTTWGTQGLIYESLLYVNQKDGNVSPWLASLPDTSADGLTLTFHITPNVKWSDGQAFTSDDVLFTFQSMQQKPDELDTVSALFKTMIASVAAPDAQTFVVTLKKPNATALYYIGDQTFIVPKHIWSTISDPGKTANEKPVGTGPFTFASFSPQIYKLAKNPSYWNTALAPKVDEVDVPAEKDNTAALLALSQGKADWAGIGYAPENDNTWVKKDPEHNHTYFPPSNVVMMTMNLNKFPFNNLAVRQAINIAIDRSELQAKAAPYAKPAHLTGLILPANDSYLASAYQNLSNSQDSAKAESILQAAGFKKDSNGIYALNGKEISFKLGAPHGWTDWNDDTKLIAQQLSKIGIKAEVQEPDFVNDYQPALANGNFDAVLHWTDPGPTPYYLYKDLLSSAQVPATNVQGWKDDATDKLLEQYANTSDAAAQATAIQGIEKIMVEQVPAIPLTYNPFWCEYSTARFTGWSDTNNPTYNPSPYSYPDIEQIILHLKPVS